MAFDTVEVDSGTYTPESLRLRRRLAEAMMQQGMQTGPIGHWSQGLARIAQAMIGGYQLGELERKEKAQQDAGNEALLGIFDGGPQSAPVAAGTASPGAMGAGDTSASPVAAPEISDDIAPYANSIASIETGNEKNPYAAIGPATRSGDRAYGKYQVMGDNVGPWTKEILGQTLTPQQFLANPDAQEKVFAGKFGSYLKQTGSPQDAASMWFTGRPASQSTQSNDGYTSQPEYLRRFNAGLKLPQEGASTAPQPVSAGSAAPQIDQATRAKIGRLLGNPATRPLGMAMIQRAMTSETKTTDDMAEWKLAKSQGYQGTFRDWQLEMKQAGRAQTTVSLAGDQSFEKEFNKLNAERLDKQRGAAEGAIGTLSANAEARKALDDNAGAFTGAGADLKLGAARWAMSAGLIEPTSDTGKAIQNTETLLAQRGQAVLDSIKTLGANPSNADLAFLNKVKGAQIDLNEGTIRRLLDIEEKLARQSIDKFNSDLKKIAPQYADRLSVTAPEPYTAPKRKAADPDKPTPVKTQTIDPNTGNAMQPGQRPQARNPNTGEVLEWDGTAWVKP